MSETQTPEELAYLALQARLIGMARDIARLDVSAFLGQIERAEAMGPILNPTLYREAGQTMAAIRDLARAADEFKRRLRKEGVLRQLGLETVPPARPSPKTRRGRPNRAAVGERV